MNKGAYIIQEKINQVDGWINTNIMQGNDLKQALEGIKNDLSRHMQEDIHLLHKSTQEDLSKAITKLEAKIQQLSSN